MYSSIALSVCVPPAAAALLPLLPGPACWVSRAATAAAAAAALAAAACRPTASAGGAGAAEDALSSHLRKTGYSNMAHMMPRLGCAMLEGTEHNCGYMRTCAADTSARHTSGRQGGIQCCSDAVRPTTLGKNVLLLQAVSPTCCACGLRSCRRCQGCCTAAWAPLMSTGCALRVEVGSCCLLVVGGSCCPWARTRHCLSCGLITPNARSETAAQGQTRCV
jgi:hypothetical protein